MSTRSSSVRSSWRDDVLTVELARPERRNAVDLDFAADLNEALVDAGRARVVLLRAAGPDFCVGGDVRAFAAAADPSVFVHRLASSFHDAVRRLHDLPGVVVSAARGWSAGAGMSLALNADICLAAESARFRPAYPAIGLSPDGGMSWLLTRALGRSAALHMILTNRVVSAAEAHRLGLVSEVVADAELDARAEELVDELSRLAPPAVRATRQLVRDAAMNDLDQSLNAEAAAISGCAGTAESRALVAQFTAGAGER